MKLKFIAFACLLTSFAHVNAQNSGKEEKKGGFGRLLKTLGEAVLDEPFGSKVIKGEWKDYGPGGGDLDGRSPRNHTGTFEITQPNANVTFALESPISSRVYITSSTGQNIGTLFSSSSSPQTFTFPRAGTYTLNTVGSDRMASGTYRLTITGASVENIKANIPEHWIKEKMSFGEEGGGGYGHSSGSFSPRNHHYAFEPKQGTTFDVNVESNGIPIIVSTIDPSGKMERSYHSGGIAYVVEEAKLKGIYKIWVSTKEEDAMGEYRMDVISKFNSEPEFVPVDQKSIKEEFTDISKQHDYIIDVTKLGVLEVIYRSTSTAGSVSLTDEYGKELRTVSNNADTPRLIDVSYKIERVGKYKLTVKTKQPTVGDYELLFWGNFDQIARENFQAGNSNISGNKESVMMKGKLISRALQLSYSGLKVAIEDLNTGLIVGSVSPNAQGDYSLIATRGTQYGITVLPVKGFLASSQNVNLTGSGPEEVIIPPIELVAVNVGAVVNLNNIFFETGKYQLLPASFGELHRIADFLSTNPSLKIEISGHTDNVGNESENAALSKERAVAVMNYFLGQRVPAPRLSAVGYGSAKPIASNSSESGRQQNRRVEFRIVGK